MNGFHLLLTLDYELPADGLGEVRRDILAPTRALLDICERHQAPLTIMAEVGELWAFEREDNAGFPRSLHYDPACAIRQQLVEAVRRGHDVQLHLHPQWIQAKWRDGRWSLDYGHYRLTDFSNDDMAAHLHSAKACLENLLSPVEPEYRCLGFRAGHWNTSPSGRYLAALLSAGLQSDTSVFKGGFCQNAAVAYDYRDAYSQVKAWYAHPQDINRSVPQTGVLIVPIATERVPLIRMLSPRRLWLARRYLREDRLITAAAGQVRSTDPSSWLTRLKRLNPLASHPRKLDFCKLTSSQLLRATARLMRKYAGEAACQPIPLVLIGHSKQVGSGANVDVFLQKLVDRFGSQIHFSTYQHFVQLYRQWPDVRGNGLDGKEHAHVQADSH